MHASETGIIAHAHLTSEHTEDVFVHKKGEDMEQYGRRIYDHVFGYYFEAALSNEETWKNRNRPKPLYSKDILSLELIQKNGADSNIGAEDPSSVSAMSSLGLKSPHDILSLRENSRIIFEALKLFFSKREKFCYGPWLLYKCNDVIIWHLTDWFSLSLYQEVGNLTFDKVDQLAVEFVTAAANIRAASFGIPLHSLFEAKGIAGNIVHVVATTNAFIAGLIVIEAIKVLKNDADSFRQRTSPTWKFSMALEGEDQFRTITCSSIPANFKRKAKPFSTSKQSERCRVITVAE